MCAINGCNRKNYNVTSYCWYHRGQVKATLQELTTLPATIRAPRTKATLQELTALPATIRPARAKLSITTSKKGNKIKANINFTNNKQLSLKLIKYHAKQLAKENNVKENNIYVKALGDIGYLTLKALNTNIDHMYSTMDDYFSDRVREKPKFTEIYSVEYTLFK